MTHVQAKARAQGEVQDNFSLFDYVKIQQGERAWIGQIIQPNQNISTVGNRLDPTILHGLELMQTHSDVQSVESVQVFDILILGQYDQEDVTTPRVRPFPGAVVVKLDAQDTSRVIGIPMLAETNGQTNVIGELLNADDVPLCVTAEMFNYHFMIAGGTGSGKSNAAANLIFQALQFDKCVLVHDAKPDYGKVGEANTDTRVAAVWRRFAPYGLEPQGASELIRVGFYKKCDPEKVDVVVGFNASDFNPDMLAGFFFTGSTSPELNAYEGFARSAETLKQKIFNREIDSYSLEDILAEVKRRDDSSGAVNADDAIHIETRKSILRKVNGRRRSMPWLDVIGHNTGKAAKNRLGRSSLNSGERHVVQAFDLAGFVKKGRLIVIDYAQMDDDHSYALILSYFLRVSQSYRKKRSPVGIVQMVDEAHRIFDNESRHSGTLARGFERVMREGRSADHSIMLSLQNASQIPGRVMNNLNSQIVMRQNGKLEADSATQTMGRDFVSQAMRLGTGHALVRLFESRATILAQMAPSPFELMRNDNTAPDSALLNDEEEDYD